MKKTVTIFTVLALLFGATAVFAQSVNKEKVVNANAKSIDELLTFALKYQNTPYQGGAEGPSSFDNPGFMKFIFKELGYELPSGSASQATAGTKVKKKDKLQKGDLVFFGAGSSIATEGIVYNVKKEGGFDFIYVSPTAGVTIGSDTGGEFANSFLYGTHITSDKELNNIRKDYAKEQKEKQKIIDTAAKKQKDLEKAKQNVDKAQKDLEKAQKAADEAALKAQQVQQAAPN